MFFFCQSLPLCDVARVLSDHDVGPRFIAIQTELLCNMLWFLLNTVAFDPMRWRMSSVFHVPHSSAIVPVEDRSEFVVSDEELSLELLRMTDWFTDELFVLDSSEFPVARFPVSRLVVDPERFADDSNETMVSRGMGVVYTKTSQGARLRSEPTPERRAQLLEKYYVPHHQRLSDLVAGALARHGRALVIDCHSFPSKPLPYELDQDPDRPDICLGTDAFHTPASLADFAQEIFLKKGFTVRINRPFSGALVPAEFYERDKRVAALMFEVNRGLYMDEETGEKFERFGAIQETLHRVVAEIESETERS